jgi:hypothetical protein
MNTTEQDFEEFAKKYPELMAKSKQTEYIGVGRGWFHILDTLFAFLSKDIERAKGRLKYAMEHPEANMGEDTIETLEAKVIKERENLPSIQQIKEKFGGLRFYVDQATHDQELAIGFAEAMSNRICEVCGSPGQHRQGGWIKTLCDRHHKANKRGEDIWGEDQNYLNSDMD